MSVGMHAAKVLSRMHWATEYIYQSHVLDERYVWHDAYTDNDLFTRPSEDRDLAYEDVLAVLEQIAAFQESFVCFDFLVRGAVTVGQLYQDQFFTHGPALIECHRLEASDRNPRVILSSDAVRLVAEHLADCEDATHSCRDLIVTDGSISFVSYMWPNRVNESQSLEGLARHRGAIVRGLSETTPEGVRQKYFWMIAYHNWFCRRYYPDDPWLQLEESTPNRSSFTTLEDHLARVDPSYG